MWLIDIRHWLDEETQSKEAVPQLKQKVKKIGEIISYATSVSANLPVDKPPVCWRRPNRKPCKGILEISLDQVDRIHWICPVCSDEGVISGWQGLIWDMSVKPSNYH